MILECVSLTKFSVITCSQHISLDLTVIGFNFSVLYLYVLITKLIQSANKQRFRH